MGRKSNFKVCTDMSIGTHIKYLGKNTHGTGVTKKGIWTAGAWGRRQKLPYRGLYHGVGG